MRTLTIDRFEGKFAICEDMDEKYFGIDLAELPQGAKEGDILEISEDGTLSINVDATKARRDKIKKKQDSLWK